VRNYRALSPNTGQSHPTACPVYRVSACTMFWLTGSRFENGEIAQNERHVRRTGCAHIILPFPHAHVLFLPDMPRQPRSARSSAHALPLRASHRAHRAPHGTRPLPSACSNLSCGTRCRCPLLARPLSTTVRHKRRPLRRPSRAVARSRDARRAARAAATAAATGEEATRGGGSERRRHRLRRLRT